MQFQCPKCSGAVSIDESNLGKTVSCGHCKAIVNAPKSRFDAGVIINDFIVERELGVGGMGVVYLARQISLDRYVALKILKEKYAEDEEFIVQFVREARSAAKLNHPNIVQAYAVGEENGIFFFAMEYVDGKTMKEILAEEKKIDPQRSAKIVREIAVALDYAWSESKIVHHDIKPDNIMLTKGGKAKLADLGLASMFGDSEVDDSGDEVLGTPQYISPEQLLGDKTDVRSDIYSLGATFYHFVTGTFPYLGDTPTEIAHKHVNGVFQPPVERDSSVPQAVNDIISKMMAKDVNQRYQSADELAVDLKKYLDSSGFISTASVPVQTVSKTQTPVPPPAQKVAPPQGGLKLSLGGAKYPPAPTPVKVQSESASQSPKSESAKIVKPAISAAQTNPAANAKTSASVPKVNLGGAAKPTVTAPTVNLGGVKTPSVSVPKVNFEGSSQSVPKVNLNKTAAPAAVVAPQLGLKKEEPPKVEQKAEPAVVPVAASEAEVKKEENKGEAKKKVSSEKSGKSKKSYGSKKKAKVSAEKKKFPAWLIILIVILFAAGGGIAFYMYKNNWKAPVIDKIKAWNAERKAAAGRIVRRVPTRKKELTIEEIRKDYLPAIEELKKFYKANPANGREFLKKTENFIAEHGMPKLEKEKAPFAELIDLYNEADEKVYMAASRLAKRREYENERKRRIDARNAEIRQAQQVEAARKAEEARIAKERQDVAERARLEQEANRQLQQKLDEYKTKTASVYPLLSKMFYEALLSADKETVFRNKVGNLFIEYAPEAVQMEVHNKLAAYAESLQKEIQPAKRIYRLMTENTERFTKHQFGLHGNMVEIISFSFPAGEVRVKMLETGRVYRLSLKDDENMKRIIQVLNKRLPREKKDIEKFPFYYQLFFGDKQKAASMKAPAPIWKEFFRYYL